MTYYLFYYNGEPWEMLGFDPLITKQQIQKYIEEITVFFDAHEDGDGYYGGWTKDEFVIEALKQNYHAKALYWSNDDNLYC